MVDVTPKYSQEQLNSDDVSKKDLVQYLQETASIQVCYAVLLHPFMLPAF